MHSALVSAPDSPLDSMYAMRQGAHSCSSGGIRKLYQEIGEEGEGRPSGTRVSDAAYSASQSPSSVGRCFFAPLPFFFLFAASSPAPASLARTTSPRVAPPVAAEA